jgi:hypothetical protein
VAPRLCLARITAFSQRVSRRLPFEGGVHASIHYSTDLVYGSVLPPLRGGSGPERGIAPKGLGSTGGGCWLPQTSVSLPTRGAGTMAAILLLVTTRMGMQYECINLYKNVML